MTHGITYLPEADQIITMKNGQISEMGTYSELLQRNGDFADFIRNYVNKVEEEEDSSDDEGVMIFTAYLFHSFLVVC